MATADVTSLEPVSNWCDGQISQDSARSLSVAVGVRNQITFAKAFGYADIAEQRQATSETAYQLASITKTMTAVAVCLLADQGLVGLDEPIETYLRGLRFNRRGGTGAPTVRQVLQHTSGLGTHFEFFYADGDGPLRSFEQTMTRYGTLFAEPGARYCYSNLGYGILDEVIRNVTGQPPETFVRDAVFLPLGMTTAYVGPTYPAGEANAARRYSGDGQPLPAYDMCHRGASAAWMSASDLVRFGFSRAGGASVLSPKMSDEMLISSVDSGGGKHYGLGWQLWQAGGYDFVGHGGGMPGVSTRLVVLPAEQIVIAVLCNQSSAGVHDLPDRVVERLLESLLPGFTAPPEDEESMPAPDGLDGAWSGEIATYAGNVSCRLKVSDRATVAVSIADSAFAEQIGGEAHRLSFPEPDLAAHVPLQLPVPDAMVRSPHLLLNLYRDGDRLTGSALAGPDLGADKRAGRLGNGYSYWCEFSREP